MDKRINIIENLHEKEAYCIDIFPLVIENEKFFEIEKYYLKYNLDGYANKVCNVLVLLWGRYDTEIYLTEFPTDSKYKRYRDMAYKNIADIGIEEICKIAKFVIINDISSMEVLIPKDHFELSIGGGFNTALYNISGSHLEFAKLIVEHEQLFLRKCTTK